MQPDITIAVGFTVAGINSLNLLRPAGSVIVIEDPDVVTRRNITTLVQDYPVVRQVIAAPHGQPETVAALFQDLRDEPVVSVVPLNEYGTIAAAQLGEFFGVPTAGAAASRILRDKHQLRQASASHGIRNPASALVQTLDQAQAFAAGVPGPVILKPSNRQGSVGTVIVRNHADLPGAWLRSQDRDEGVLAPRDAFAPLTLIEEFVTGAEFSVEALVRGGEFLFANVTRKELFGGDRPVEAAHVVPAPITAANTDLLVAQTRTMLRGIGFQTGIVHCEWLMSDGQPYLVECAGRFAGDGIIDLICRAYEFDIVDMFHRLMRGEDLPQLPHRALQTAMVRFLGGTGGTIAQITQDSAALDHPGIVSCDMHMKPGDPAPLPASSWDRLGSVTTVAPNAAAADRLARQALAAFHITYAGEDSYADAI